MSFVELELCCGKPRMIQSIHTEQEQMRGREDAKMPYGLDWEWLWDLIRGKGGKEKEESRRI